MIGFQEKEEGKDEVHVTFELEEPPEPTPTIGQRILASLQYFKTRLADLFVHFVILPNSKLRLIKYINCLFVFATTLTITYMVSNKIAKKKQKMTTLLSFERDFSTSLTINLMLNNVTRPERQYGSCSHAQIQDGG